MGDALSAVDIYWATFCAMIRPLAGGAESDARLPARGLRRDLTAEVEAAVDEELIAHRDKIYQRHLELPLDF